MKKLKVDACRICQQNEDINTYCVGCRKLKIELARKALDEASKVVSELLDDVNLSQRADDLLWTAFDAIIDTRKKLMPIEPTLSSSR